MPRKEIECHDPTADAPRQVAPPHAPSPHLPLLLHDRLTHAHCSRRDALLLLATIALLPAPALTAPAENGSRLRRLLTRFAADPRLGQKRSVTAWSEPLEELLARLSGETGVALRFEGREIGDQRVNVVLKEQPLSRTLVLLAEALDLYWRRERKGGVYRYVLFQDTASRKQEQEIHARFRERFEDGIQRMVASLKLTPPEIDALRSTCGWAWHLEQPTRRLAIEILGRLAPRHLKHALDNGVVDVPFASLPPGDQSLVLRFVELMNSASGKRNRERGLPPDHHVIGDMTRPGSTVSLSILGGIPVGWGSFIDVHAEGGDGKGSYLGVIPGYTDAEVQALEEELRPPRFPKESHASPDGWPRLTPATLRWEDKTYLPWEEVLKAVAKSGDLQVIGDSFLYYWWEENSTLPSPLTLQDRPLPEVLDAITTPYLYVWRREGDIYLFRHRNGFVEKRHNIPERDIRRWRAHLKAGARIPLDDLAEVALLTDRQRGMVNHRGIPTRSAGGHRTILRLYAALDSVQRGKLETTGLPIREMRAPQVERLRAWKPEAAEEPDARVRLRREAEAALFSVTAAGRAPREERVPLETGHTPTVA